MNGVVKTNSDLWVAEYSKSQGAFNVDSLQNVLSTNKRMTIDNQNNDYQIFAICKSIEEASNRCKTTEIMQQAKESGAVLR